MPRVHKPDRHDAALAVKRYRDLTGDRDASYLRDLGDYGVTYSLVSDCGPEIEARGARAFVQRMTDYLDGYEAGKAAGFEEGYQRGIEEADAAL